MEDVITLMSLLLSSLAVVGRSLDVGDASLLVWKHSQSTMTEARDAMQSTISRTEEVANTHTRAHVDCSHYHCFVASRCRTTSMPVWPCVFSEHRAIAKLCSVRSSAR
eukprot:jgi/Bigna1/62189/fgenesh1_kg.31_\